MDCVIFIVIFHSIAYESRPTLLIKNDNYIVTDIWLLKYCINNVDPKITLVFRSMEVFLKQHMWPMRGSGLHRSSRVFVEWRLKTYSTSICLCITALDYSSDLSDPLKEVWWITLYADFIFSSVLWFYISGGPLSALTCCVNARLLSAIKKISPLIYSQSWVGSWVYTTQAIMTFSLIF